MQNCQPANPPLETPLEVRAEPPPCTLEAEAPQPAISAARLRRLAQLLF